MPDILSIASNALNNVGAAAFRTAQAVASTSSAGDPAALTDNLTALAVDKTAYAADIAVAKVAQRLDQATIDILV